jgi:hypothetical protein
MNDNLIQLQRACASCGSERKLYQNGLCQPCLQKSFEQMIPMINAFRSMNGLRSVGDADGPTGAVHSCV